MSLKDRLLPALDRMVGAWENTSGAASGLWEKAGPLRRGLRAQGARSRRHPLAWATVYALVLVLLGYFVLDRPLAWWFKAHLSAEVEGFFKVVTRLGQAELYLVPAGLLWAGYMLASLAARSLEDTARLRRLSMIPGFVFASIAVSGIIGNLVKFSLGRYRPRYLFDDNLYGFTFFNHGWAMNSFPSGHTQAAFAAMTALTLVFPRYDVAFIAIAVLVAMSRVVTTVHYFGDVVAGAWLAVMVTVLLHRWLKGRGIDVRVRLPRDRRLLD